MADGSEKEIACEAPYVVRNRGPWVTVEYRLWDSFSLGQTTALADGAGSNFSDPELRTVFLSQFDLKSHHQPRQVHETRVCKTENYSACYPRTDGLIESRRRSAISILTADCMPVFIRSLSGDDFALVHAGWRGLAAGIVPCALKKGFPGPVEIIVGAHIQQTSYQVGENVMIKMAQSVDCTVADLRAEGIVNSKGGLSMFAVLERQMERFPVKRIYKLGFNSAAEGFPPLPSYRRDRTEDRMLHWIFKR
jgi:hypothetical protein